MDDDQYVLPDQLTFHAAVFSGCAASELISYMIFWLMCWSIFLGFLAIVGGLGIIAIAPILILTFISLLLTAFTVRRLRNNRPPGALGQMAVKWLDNAGFISCRFIVHPGSFTGSRSKQLVRVGAQLVSKLPAEERVSVSDAFFDGEQEEY